MKIIAFSTKKQARLKKILVLTCLTFIAYYSSSQREQSLLWLMSALLSASLISGLVWPHWLVKHLSVTRTAPIRAKEGEIISFKVKVTNLGWVPRFMIEVMDKLPFVNDVDETTLGVVAYINAGATQDFEASITCEKRGYYQLGPTVLASSFPFGLKEVRQSKEGDVQSLTIYPEIFPIISLPFRGCADEIHRGSVFLPEGSGVAEFSGLREYRHGDNPRHVHWLSTARLNELMVMEFEPLASASLYLALDLSESANIGNGKYASFEYAMRIAASISRYACDKNIPIQVYSEAERSINLSLATGESHFQKILDLLAVTDAKRGIPYAKVLQKISVNCRYGQTIVVFLAQPESEREETLQAISLLLDRGSKILAIVLDRETFMNRKPSDPQYLLGLTELNIPYFIIRKHDNLTNLFNQ